MRLRVGFLLTCAAGALLIGAGPMVPEAHAQTAMNAAAPVPFWWFHGELEAGGRVFLNNPQRNGVNSAGGKSLAKYYEYSSIKPGAFVDGHVATGSNDGLYQVDIWAKNVGYDDQKFNLDASKAGQQYFNFEWDQTPHVYSTSAQTLYNGVGTNALTLPAGLSAKMFGDAGCIAGTPPTGCGSPITAANAAKVKQDIQNNVHQTDIGIRRDTASVEYRWTPTDAWDVKADYSNMRRTGTQVAGVVFSPGSSGVKAEVPAPVADTTQNFGLNGEYAGTSPWDQKFNFKLGYAGSTFKEDDDSYTVENPFCSAGAGPGGCARNASPSSPLARMTMDPDNYANMFTGTLGADLPFKSRYMGTVSYNMMRQNQPFLNTISSTVFTDAANTAALMAAPPGLPASSLNGGINTLLSNNVLTTQITPDLKSKLSYRYYDFDNQTPELYFPDWVVTDTKLASVTNATYAPVRSISVSYNKQNAGADLNWRPTRQWNVGVAYGHERYQWTRADVDVTNENSGKVYADWQPTSWITTRGSWSYSARRYDNYDYLGNVGKAQWPNGNTGGTWYTPTYRQFFLTNRDRNKGQASIAVDVIRGLTITPTAGYRDDEFNLNPVSEVGLKHDKSYNAGVEVGYLVSPDTRFLLSYMNEYRSQAVTSAGTSVSCTDTVCYTANVVDKVNTFIASVDHALIPNKLDLRLGYTVSYAVNSQPLLFDRPGGTPTVATGGQYPDMKTTFQRLEALAKYKFDQEQVRQLGWKGEVTAKLRYAWERNSVANWQIDSMQTYMQASDASAGYMTWLAGNNPNYSVQLITASLAWTW